jgi:hypothetical protein
MLALRRCCLWISVCFAALGCDGDSPLAPGSAGNASVGPGSAPSAPSNATAVAASHTQINVSWRDNSANESGFELYRSTTGASGTFSLLVSTGANATSYNDGGLTAASQYCYKVLAFRILGGKGRSSGFSNTACATTLLPPPPNAPSATNAVPQSSSSLAVSWIDNSADEQGFRVEWSPNGTADWSTVTTTLGNVTAVQDAGRPSEQQVCYRVIAFNAGGDSPASITDCTTPPAAPTGLTATGLDGPVIDLTWTDNSASENGYEIRRSDDGVTFNVVARVPANSAGYSDRTVSANAIYSYIVAAMKDGGLSDFSTAISAQAGALKLGRIVTWGNTMMKFTGSAAFRVLLEDFGGDTDDYILVRNILQQLSGKSSNVRILYTDTCDPRTDPDVCLVGGLEYLQPFYDMIASIGTITYADIATVQLADFDVVIADFCSLPSQDYDLLRSYLSSGGPAMVLGDNFCWPGGFSSSADLANSVIASLGVFFLNYELYEYERLLIAPSEQVGLLSGVSNLSLWRIAPQYISEGFVPIAIWNDEVLYTVRSGAMESHMAAAAPAITARPLAGPLRPAVPGQTLVESLLRTELRVDLRALQVP